MSDSAGHADAVEHVTTCWECGIEIATRTAEPMQVLAGGRPADLVHVPFCKACKARWEGCACEDCGKLRMSILAAEYCCTQKEMPEVSHAR